MIRNIFIAIAICAIVMQSTALIVTRTKRSSETCGVSKSRMGLIVHGQPFPRGAFPWIVALMFTETRPPTFFCAGTLISKTFVISAAHCILPKHAKAKLLPRQVLAVFGAHDLADPYERGRISHSPSNIYIHDDWNQYRESYDADVALLKFDEGDIHFSSYIQPICLWDSDDEPVVTEGTVTGWGKSEDPNKLHENVPKLIKAPIQTNGDCFLEAKDLVDLSSRRTFCAGQRDGSGVCTGDSGGGFFFKVDGVYHLKGIVSSSLVKDDGCDVSKNAIYANVIQFKYWIKSVTKLGVNANDDFSVIEKGDVDNNNDDTTPAPSKTNFSIEDDDDNNDKSTTPASSNRSLSCTFDTDPPNWYRELHTCRVAQDIDNEECFLESPSTDVATKFHIQNNKWVEFLPRGIGEKLPNLIEFRADFCALTVIRDFYFKNMQKLEVMYLNNNQIATVEPEAFRDLVNVKTLYLGNNILKALDGNVFDPMINLKTLSLFNNPLTPESRENICVGRFSCMR